MKTTRAFTFGLFLLPWVVWGQTTGENMNTSVVRIAELEIVPAQIEKFKTAGIENITNTLNAEPGVREFHAVIKRDLPGRVVILEVYADQRAYEAHTQSPHFKRFGSAVASLVTNKTLLDVTPLILGRKPSLSAPNPHVRIAEIDVEPSRLDAYKAAVVEEIEASIRVEPGVLAIFSVSLKDAPNQLRFFEIYSDEGAYQRHRESLHFKKYLEVTKPMIRSLKLFEAEPIMLGTRPGPTVPSGEGATSEPRSREELRAVAPALEHYAQTTLMGDLWKRPELSARDRSIVTLATLIARNHTTELSAHMRLALDHGVKPAEISEIITHLAFYSGWGNAMAAVAAAKEVFDERGIGPDQVAVATPDQLLPLDRAAEERRAKSVQENTGPVSPGLVHYTGELLFKELWLRPALAPRDRSLVTVSALIATGQAAQITFHLNKAMDNGLTQTQAGEVPTHVAFYAGWPSAFTAVPVMKAVFESRAPSESGTR